MKLHELSLRVKDFTAQADAWVERHRSTWADGKHVGDIEQLTVKRSGSVFTVWDKDEIVCCCSVDTVPNAYTVIDNLWVAELRRGQKLMSKLLWFLKTREGFSKMLLGKMHSDLTYNMVKGMRTFKKTWVWTGWGEKEPIPFDPDTMDDFYDTFKPTGWQLMLENDGDINFPRFAGGGFVQDSFDPYIE